jgi:hypothetical protein
MCEPDIISTDMIDEESGSRFVLANNNAVDFYFYYPENFILDKNAAMISVFIPDYEWVESEFEESTLRVPVNPNLSAYVLSYPNRDFDNAAEYWEVFYLPSISQGFSDIHIESSEDIEITQTPARKYIYTANLGGQEYKYAVVIFLRNTETYTLTYTATPDKFDAHSGVLDVVIDTFAFKD